MNHRAKFDTASFVIDREISNRTNKQTNKQTHTHTHTHERVIFIKQHKSLVTAVTFWLVLGG